MKKAEDKKPSITKGEVDGMILLGILSSIEEIQERLDASNLHSTKFWKRSLAVVGHYFAFILAVWAVCVVIVMFGAIINS